MEARWLNEIHNRSLFNDKQVNLKKNFQLKKSLSRCLCLTFEDKERLTSKYVYLLSPITIEMMLVSLFF